MLLTVFMFQACGDDNNGPTDPPSETGNIAEVASSNDDFSDLVSALQDADLVSTLEGDGPFTVFAPTNEAFANLDVDISQLTNEQLVEILSYHVVGDEIASGDLSAEQAVPALAGGDLFVTAANGNVSVNDNATVVDADIEASNGLIHAVDQVLLPDAYQSVVGIVSKRYNLQSLEDAVVSAELASKLSGEGPFTVFAPTNAAFEGVDLSALSQQELQDILTYHVLPSEVLSVDITEGSFETVNGATVEIAVSSEGAVTLTDQAGNMATVTTVDLDGTNGVVHVIDGVLSPTAPQSGTTIEINNVGASAWEVTSIDGNDASASLNTENTEITLESGARYTFVNNGGDAHPLELRTSGNDLLLAQGSATGSYESDSNVNFEVNGNEVSFTLTQSLASELAAYYCGIHSSMNGSISIQ